MPRSLQKTMASAKTWIRSNQTAGPLAHATWRSWSNRGLDIALPLGFGCTLCVWLSALNYPGPVPLLGWAIAFVVGHLLGFLGWPLELVASRASSRGRAGACLATGALLGLLTAQRLGAFAKLGGKHETLALMTALGGPLVGAILAATLSWLALLNWTALTSRQRWTARLAGLASLLVGLAGIAADETIVTLRSYPALVSALAATNVALLALPVRLLMTSMPRPQKVNTGLALLLLLCFLPAAVWTASASSQRFSPLLGYRAPAQQIALLRWLSDFDRDGHSSLFGGGDCAPFDSNVHPGALEIPGNGIDDNCQFGDAVPRILPTLPQVAKHPPSPVNVLLISSDSLRADHMAIYGYRRANTPHLATLASNGRIFSRAHPNGAWTALSLPSLFTSALPRDLTWHDHAPTDGRGKPRMPARPEILIDGQIFAVWPARAELPWPPLPWWLAQRDMHTIGVVPQEIYQQSRRFFGHDFQSLQSGGMKDADITRKALDSLRHTAEPWFLWVHYYGTHYPYQANEHSPDFGAGVVDRYDRSIAAFDWEINQLIEFADRSSNRKVAVIVTADHGEDFDAVGGFHGVDLRESCLHVPLVTRGPGLLPGTDTSLVSLVDLMPTILDWTGTNGPPVTEGVPLGRVPPARVLIADLWRHDLEGHLIFNGVRAMNADYRLDVDLLLGRRHLSHLDGTDTFSATGGPATAMALLNQAIGAYLERAVGGP